MNDEIKIIADQLMQSGMEMDSAIDEAIRLSRQSTEEDLRLQDLEDQVMGRSRPYKRGERMLRLLDPSQDPLTGERNIRDFGRQKIANIIPGMTLIGREKVFQGHNPLYNLLQEANRVSKAYHGQDYLKELHHRVMQAGRGRVDKDFGYESSFADGGQVFASDTDKIAQKLIEQGLDRETAMAAALRMAQSRQQANESILGGVPTQPPTSDVPPATEILGGDPSKLFQRQPTTMERIRNLPKDVLGAGEALVSMGSLAALAPASMLYALRPGQKTQGDPMEFALRNMYMPRSERGPSHLAGLGEVLESLPQTGPLPELQAFTGVGRGVGRQLAEKGRQAGRAMAPAAANVAEDILRRQGLLMDLTAYHGSPHKFAPTEKNPLGEFNPEKIGTGEGAQAYGYGHYLAESRGVGQDYADVLASPRNRVMDRRGVYIEPSPMGGGKYMLAVRSEVGQPKGVAGDATQLIYTDKEFPNLASAIKFARQKGLLSRDQRQRLTAIGEDRKYVPVTKASDVPEPEYTQFIASDPGYLYTVDVPDKMVDKMLDWDKPLSKQSDAVQQALKSLGFSVNKKDVDNYADALLDALSGRGPTDLPKEPLDLMGETIYKKLGPPQIASQKLRELGVSGIRYLDQGSRGNVPTVRKVTVKGKTKYEVNPGWNAPNKVKFFDSEEEAQKHADSFITRNFVVFPGEEKDLKILERKKEGGSVNHKAVASARRALEKAMAKGGEVKMGTGGSMLGTVAGRAAAAGKAGAKAAKAAKPTKFEVAQRQAQINAAKPIEEGGLGLRPDNTADERAAAQGYIDYYHGTERLDRLLEKPGLDPKRATSGPMPYGTTTRELASNYAMSKADTSRRAEDLGEVQNYFQVSPKDMGLGFRSPLPVERLWYFLSPEQKQKVMSLAPRVGYENLEDFSGKFTVHPEGVNATLSPSQWDFIMKREAKGNPLTALRQMWYESGQLVDDPSQLAEIYRLAGIDAPISQTNAPWTSAQGVLLGKARVKNPLDTSNVEQVQSLIPKLEEAFKRDRSRTSPQGTDQWDKRTRYTPRQWVSDLKKDVELGQNSYVWTSIPDKVTNELKRFGFDSIIDKSGKGGGSKEPVVIPFSPEQIRSRFAAFDPMEQQSPDLLKKKGGLSALRK